MIKVLEYGQRYVVTCPSCHSKFEYGIEDIDIHHMEELRDNEKGGMALCTWNVRGIECPVCASIIEDGLYEKTKTEMDRDGTSESALSGYCEADEDKRKIKDLRYCPALNNFCDEDCPCYKEESND